MLAHPFLHRGVLVGRVREKVEDGRLTDEATRDFLAAYLEGVAAFARRFG